LKSLDVFVGHLVCVAVNLVDEHMKFRPNPSSVGDCISDCRLAFTGTIKNAV
jgi:hypothetical protein